jgi:hypothetical protein
MKRALCAIAVGLSLWSSASGVACAPPPAVEMVDVTPVWPLPASADLEARGFIGAATEAAHGVVFPRAVFDATPALTRVDEPDVIYANLAVVGARVDPCFQEGLGDPPCEASVRLVLQSILPSPTDAAKLAARDASIHAFYVVDDQQEILDAIAALATARVDAGRDGGGPLGVHPLLKDDAGRAQVRDVLLRLIGADRLVRVTSMEVHGDSTAWTFAGFAVNELGTFSDAHEVFAQHVLSVGTAGAIEASVDPELSPGPDNFTVLLDEETAAAATLAERQAAFDAAARVENPLLHNALTIDCVSCHLAATARATALLRDPLSASADAYVSERYDVTPSAAFENTQLIHNLGYRFDILALSPRLVNETALTAERADALLHP